MSGYQNIHVLSRAVVIDQGHILVCQTLDLPISFYFLPGGHVEYGESVENTVLRELREEAGVEAKVKRFLGCLEHSFEPGHNSICHNHEYNFIFEVEASALTLQQEIPQLEAHIKLVWLPLANIEEIDFRPQSLRSFLPLWLNQPSSQLFQSVMIDR